MQKPILITGIPRSGTTWVGNIIPSAPGVGYIYEPFLPVHHVGICKVEFPLWFTYITEKNEDKYYKDLRNTLEFKYGLFSELINVTL